MLTFLKRHKETLLVILLGLVIFSLLNLLMVQWHPDRWTSLRYGAWSCFHKGFSLSGFDQHTYIIVSEWRPLYELYRHPLLAMMIWPLSEINTWLKDYTDINSAIYIIAVLWTLISTCSWVLLYKIHRKLIELNWWQSLLLTFFFFGFSHVMLATFAPDHMVLTMTLLLLTIYLLGKQAKRGKVLSWWKMMIIYFLGIGITTTNSIKIWLMDMTGRYDTSLSWKRNIPVLFKRSLWFIIPTLLVGWLYLWQLDNTQRQESEHADRIVQTKLKTDTAFKAQYADMQAQSQKREKMLKGKQITDSKYLAWTDNSVDRLPLLWENIFGEGFILHEEHLLEDANIKDNPRPVFVEYSHWWDHAAESVIIVLFVAGLWYSRRERLLYLCLFPMLFDVILHVGLRFAASDVYIMTAHWAFIIPISIAFMAKRLSSNKIAVCTPMGITACLTLFLWWHNVSLIAKCILKW